MKKIEIAAFGGSETLQLVDAPMPTPTGTQLLVKVAAAGVNFVDIYQRNGNPVYGMTTPYTPGMEGAGVVEAVGSDVADIKVGDRVAWTWALGSYAEYAIVEEAKAVIVPQGLELEEVAAFMLQGITGHYLTNSTYEIKPGDIALVHAAAGGTGSLLAQLILLKGGVVIGTTSTEAKEATVRALGVQHVIRYDKEDFVAEVKKITGGRGVDVVYDGVGAKTFDQSLQCLKPRGMMVLFGAASGPVPPFEIMRLNSSGSLFLTRPTLAHYVADAAEFKGRCAAIFTLLLEGKLTVRIDKRYALGDARAAHDDLASAQTSGKLVLIP
ncbi:MAG: quinone oxidoreductase [Actinobacteria bacterium]|jgi:NADPH2:quinone reductase|nr:quinone oxidoreductase [Actinomycetota bacterium]